MTRPVAILSTTLLQLPGEYRYEVLTDGEGLAAARDIPHYVGHPATRYLLDQAGARYTPGLFSGLSPGESFIVCQLIDPRKGAAFTADRPNVTPADLKWGLVTRLPVDAPSSAD